MEGADQRLISSLMRSGGCSGPLGQGYLDLPWTAVAIVPGRPAQQAWADVQFAVLPPRAGQIPAPVARPFALMLAGRHREAVSIWRDLGCPLWSACALALPPKTEDAQECLDILGPLGASAVHHAVLRARHAQGLTVPRGPRPASRGNPAGLTAREIEVLGLVADGLSYAEVAERLILPEKTVGHHVSAALRKLSEPTRSKAVATALRLGIIQQR